MDKIQILLEALPYIKEYSGKTVVVKIGGKMMEEDSLLQDVLDNIVLMKYIGIKVVLVHGGGQQITEMMKKKNLKIEFVDGLRITTKETVDIVKKVLVQKINKKIVSLLNQREKIAVGISGDEAGFIECRKKYGQKNGQKIDLGFVGKIVNINSRVIENILAKKYLPVIATLGTDNKGNIYNINADDCASEIAVFQKAARIIFLTDVDGVFKKTENKNKAKIISKLTAKECLAMIKRGEINYGMLPKTNACLNSLKRGVRKAHILNGTKKDSILMEVFTDKGVGTMITL